MKHYHYKDKGSIDLEVVQGINKAWDYIYFTLANGNIIDWNFNHNEEERDNVYSKILILIESTEIV